MPKGKTKEYRFGFVANLEDADHIPTTDEMAEYLKQAVIVDLNYEEEGPAPENAGEDATVSVGVDFDPPNLEMTSEEFEFMQDVISAQIQAFFDDLFGTLNPPVNQTYEAFVEETRSHLRLLQSLTNKFDLKWDEVLENKGVTDFEKMRVQKIVAEN